MEVVISHDIKIKNLYKQINSCYQCQKGLILKNSRINWSLRKGPGEYLIFCRYNK
jgi:hypothetical protein